MAWKPRGGTPRRTRWQKEASSEVVAEREDRLAHEAKEYLKGPSTCHRSDQEHMRVVYGFVFLNKPEEGETHE